ncbi:TetR/AcrR family transcriptional regulator [Microbulbifer spongiae]|uniref:TetR/AcrR family transcriptional regulator n=1 Tax=Microbulbifer spongiae TaxID=2944933 RepID=A0ABY9EFF8_9GAMM|nr:TetR/AcrR family transcriptional regulator [Microbulbifer sp. MI-G]WKD51146.1 TetR/AcrR family transcriptional regulator [Microbulbifer sp. MI-G]
MPRPSLKAERTETILDAVETCVIQYGVHGTTLEKIAEVADMRRSLLRHNIGNREAILDAFLDRFFTNSEHEVATMLSCLPGQDRIPILLDLLFDEYQSTSQLALVALSLTAAAASDTTIRERLHTWNHQFVVTMTDELARSYPNTNRDDVYAAAAGLVGIYFNTESLAPLGDMQTIRQASKHAAERLIETLEGQGS